MNTDETKDLSDKIQKVCNSNFEAGAEMASMGLPSRFKPEEMVRVDFTEQAAFNGRIIAVKFDDGGKVLYDVALKVEGGFTSIESVDSAFVKPL